MGGTLTTFRTLTLRRKLPRATSILTKGFDI